MAVASNRKPKTENPTSSFTRCRKVLENPEEVLNLAQRWLEQGKRHWPWLLAGVVALAVVLGGWGVHGYLKERRERQAGEALALMRPQFTGTAAATQGLKSLREFIQEYSGTRAAYEAGVTRANLLYQEQKYAEAAKAYESLLKDGDTAWDAIISESLSYCYEGMGDVKQATQVLKPLVDKTSGPLQSEIRRRLALLYEQAEDRKEAAVYWRQLLDHPPDPALKPYLREKVAACETTERVQK